ncbi:glycosyltransferase [uncultured Draconibacterium sp.]|uniref:glycosyltransferase n=1 Tax=uncultured Draconibacterium sp. TaxID=1573823 RepID=UPI0029C8CDDB|nr:glycosyltransferase [uncultured Draconibacterium sp.]
MTEAKQKIVFIYSPWSTFIKTDYDILASKYEVVKYQFKPQKGLIKVGLQFLKQLLFLAFNIWRFDILYIWFGDYHSFLPVLFSKVFKKKSFVVIGGYDVANLPEINYGSLSRPLRKKLTLFSFRHASLCLPVVEGLEEKLKQVCPKAKSKTIHTGYQFQLNEKLDFDATREKIVLTVSITENYQRYMVKGLDRFKELAKKLPEYKFIVVGVKEVAKSLFEPIPKNLILYPPVEQNKLISFYKQASYYAQFSRSEGLPNALCEAMLYGCIPLGMEVGGITTAIDRFGLSMDNWTPDQASQFINQDRFLDRKKISEHITAKFDLSARIKKLLQTVSA